MDEFVFLGIKGDAKPVGPFQAPTVDVGQLGAIIFGRSTVHKDIEVIHKADRVDTLVGLVALSDELFVIEHIEDWR